MFVGKEPTLEGSTYKTIHSDRLLASPINIKLGGKGLPGTTLYLLRAFVITDVKSFITSGPGVKLINIFTSVAHG